MAKVKRGSGARFAALKESISKRNAGPHPRGGKKIKNPGAVAAAIGRKKYGKAQFQKLAAAGRTHKIRSS